ncbi:MAG: hypothetical protein HMLKMBBP_02693 [Planctomycetes bacterium]|nr:hypothetical protein [Planctomycetota bacterium]
MKFPSGSVALVRRPAASYSTVVSLLRRSFEDTTSERLSKATVLASQVVEELPIRPASSFHARPISS